MSPTELGEAQIPIRGTLDKLDSDLAAARGKVESAISGIVSNVKKIGGVALGIGGAGLTAIAGVGAAVGKMAIDAAPVEGLQSAFAGLSESAGVGMDDMLTALKKGSAGMVANRDLMKSFNQAASLVSIDFAKQLPDAMSYLGKVSSSTGEDLGFLLDSLVKGVGRLSPAILDNLAIQVNLAQASERASEMFGVEAEELSKAQLQAGMMNVVLEKLAENTAAMPDVSESAAAKMAQLQATFQNIKDQIGMAFLPVLTTLLGTLAQVGEVVLPVVTQALDAVAPIVERVAGAFDTFVSGILAGEDPISALGEALQGLFPPEISGPIIDAIHSVRDGVQAVIDAVAPYVEMAAAWISENVKLQDVLIGLGIAIATVVIPAILPIIGTVAAVIATFIAVIAVVAALRQAWESDFLGIRTFIEETLEKIRAWWAEHGDQVIAKAQEIYDTIKEGIETALNAIKEFWAEHGDEILAKAQEIWEGIVGVFEWFKGVFMDLYDAFRLAFEGDWYGFGEKLREVWDEVWAKISEIGSAVWEAIKTFFSETDWGSIGRGILEGVGSGITGGLEWLKDAARSAAKAALEAAKGFLGIKSPSEAFAQVGRLAAEGFAMGLGSTDLIERAAAAMGRVALQASSTTLNGLAAQSAAGNVDNSRRFEFNMYGAIDERSVFGAYETVRAMEG
jgi:phage-related protein